MSNTKINDDSVHGIHAVLTLLNTSPEKIKILNLNKNRHDKKFNEIISIAKKNHIPLQYISDYDKKTQGITAICHQKVKSFPHHSSSIDNLEDLFEMLTHSAKLPLLLILDGVQDPHNLGACIRTANSAGADAVIIPADKSATLNATVKKVAVGAAEYTPVITVTNLSRACQLIKEKGVWIYGMDGKASKSLYQENFTLPTAFILGSESEGLRRLTAEQCDSLLSIPMKGQVESLNVSVAAGICLYESVRQRK